MDEGRFIRAAGLPVLESAGGLVVNRAGLALFILKGGRWDLPKGRIEAGSSREQTALREVVEETAIEPDQLKIICPLCQTWHKTSYEARDYIKKTAWFVMDYGGRGEKLRPRLEENITECRWIHPDNFRAYGAMMRPRIYYAANLWRKVFFDRGIGPGAARAAVLELENGR